MRSGGSVPPFREDILTFLEDKEVNLKLRYLASSFMLLAVVLLSSAGMTNSTQAATPQATLPALTKQVKIAVIMPSAKNDLAWSQSMYDALLRVQKDAGGSGQEVGSRRRMPELLHIAQLLDRR